jgi:hypothetical protein
VLLSSQTTSIARSRVSPARKLATARTESMTERAPRNRSAAVGASHAGRIHSRALTTMSASSPAMATSTSSARIVRSLPNTAYTVCTATSASSAIAWIVVAPYPSPTNSFLAATTVIVAPPMGPAD